MDVDVAVVVAVVRGIGVLETCGLGLRRWVVGGRRAWGRLSGGRIAGLGGSRSWTCRRREGRGLAVDVDRFGCRNAAASRCRGFPGRRASSRGWC